MMRQAIALRHVAFEDLGLLDRILANHDFESSYLDAPTSLIDDAGLTQATRDARDADLLIVLGGPIGVADVDSYPFLGAELELIRHRVDRDLPILGICLGAQLLAVACGGSVQPGSAAEIGYAPVTVTDDGHGSVLEPLADVSVLHWHGDVISTPAGLPALLRTPVCANQAFASGTNALGLQFHLEADVRSLERWLVGHAYELATRDIDIDKLRSDAARYGPELAARAQEVFDAWLSALTFPETEVGAGQVSSVTQA
jgi:GMP synthase (glutamine-hydrolysing)